MDNAINFVQMDILLKLMEHVFFLRIVIQDIMVFNQQQGVLIHAQEVFFQIPKHLCVYKHAQIHILDKVQYAQKVFFCLLDCTSPKIANSVKNLCVSKCSPFTYSNGTSCVSTCPSSTYADDTTRTC